MKYCAIFRRVVWNIYLSSEIYLCLEVVRYIKQKVSRHLNRKVRFTHMNLFEFQPYIYRVNVMSFHTYVDLIYEICVRNWPYGTGPCFGKLQNSAAKYFSILSVIKILMISCVNINWSSFKIYLTLFNLITVQQDATVFSLLHFCMQLYMFRVLTPIIKSWYSCNYSFWYWLTGSTTIRSLFWVGTDSCVSYSRYTYRTIYMNQFNSTTTADGSRTGWPVPEAVITTVPAPDGGCQHPKHVELPTEM